MSKCSTLSQEYETCVLCGQQTEYKIDVPVEFRSEFIPGAGQLCKKCYRELYLCPSCR